MDEKTDKKGNKSPIVDCYSCDNKNPCTDYEKGRRSICRDYLPSRESLQSKIKQLEGRIKRILDNLDTDQCPATKLGEVIGGETEHLCCMLDIGHEGQHECGDMKW